MRGGWEVAHYVGAASAFALLLTLPGFWMAPRLAMPGWLKVMNYGGTAACALCFGLLLLSMGWGLQTDWSARSKALMMLGIMAVFPAIVGTIIWVITGIVGHGDGTARAYFLVLGLLGCMVLFIPTIIASILWLPGKP